MCIRDSYAFDAPALYEHIDRLTTANPHAEYYLTDMAAVLHRARKRVVAVKTSDAGEVLGSNTRAEMMMLDARLRLAKCRELLDAGVTIFYPHTCVIDSDVEVGADTVIEPFVQLLGHTTVSYTHLDVYKRQWNLSRGKKKRAPTRARTSCQPNFD